MVTPVHFIFGQGDALYKRSVPAFPFTKNGLQFDENTQPEAGWLVLCKANPVPVLTRVPQTRRIFVIGESSHSQHVADYLNQFGLVIAPFRPAGYSGRWFQSHPGLPWFFRAAQVGGTLLPTLGYQDLASLPVPEKRDGVSVVLSTKSIHPGHRKRLRFVERMKNLLGSRLTVFGRGLREISDKADAILPFACHLALENTIEPHYWTEKLPDALLGYALPIYSGSVEAWQRLPAESFERVDIERPDEAAARITNLLNRNTWRERLPLILEARTHIMEQETIFNVVDRAITAFPDETPVLPTLAPLLPPRRWRLSERIRREIARGYHQITFRTSLSRKA